MNDGRADVYLVQAARCLKLAQGSHDTANKLTLLDLARAWLTIAEQGEKNRSVTLVDESGKPRLPIPPPTALPIPPLINRSLN
jgi:hypothetical protein